MLFFHCYYYPLAYQKNTKKGYIIYSLDVCYIYLCLTRLTMNRILNGIKVLDLSRILAGPYTAQMLADLGANVTKVEAPWGDDTRRWGPPFTTGFDGKEVAAYYLCCNRGKNLV